MSATIIPTMRYRDAAAAVEWLCQAFGFARRLVVPGENGTIVHSELTIGNGMIMLGSARDDAFGRLCEPASPDRPVTQSSYILVEHVDAHCARAKAAGAKIVMEIRDEDDGGRDYSCRDSEGHLWNFGAYDPWARGNRQ